MSELTDTFTQADEAFRPRELSGSEVASLLRAAGYEPLRRWGSQRGVFGVWASCVEGGKVRLTLSTANRASSARGLEGLRELVTRGLQTPVTRTRDGAAGLTKALDALWPQALRVRGW